MNLLTSKIKIINISFSVFFCTTFTLLKATSATAFNITFDYSYDSNGFFSGPKGQTRRNTLDRAGQYYEDYISDNLSAIANDPTSTTGIGYEYSNGNKNTWTTSFNNPATGSSISIVDPTFSENEIIIYAGGRDLVDSLGIGGAGGSSYSTFSGSGTDSEGNSFSYSNQDFVDLIKGRGQTGALADPVTDIGLWGGSITFDTDISIDSTSYNWHNDISSTGLDSNEYDFLSVAIHEVAHVMGFGGSSWDTQISGTDFLGTNAINAYNQANDSNVSAVPLETNSTSHWEDGTEGLTVEGIIQEAVLDPSITNGQRKLMTNLDYAGLADAGWTVDPNVMNVNNVPFEFSPALGILFSCSGFGLLAMKNQLKKRKLESETDS